MTLPVNTTVLKTNTPKTPALKNENQIPAENSNQPPNDWQTYRTRFTIRARTLSAPLSFVDALGREQNGKRGDYLVESNGMVTITPRHIFEDVYVPMEIATDENGGAINRREFGNGTTARFTASPSAQPPRKSPISTTKRSFMPGSRRRPG